MPSNRIKQTKPSKEMHLAIEQIERFYGTKYIYLNRHQVSVAICYIYDHFGCSYSEIANLLKCTYKKVVDVTNQWREYRDEVNLLKNENQSKIPNV